MIIQKILEAFESFDGFQLILENDHLNNNIINIKIMDIPWENAQLEEGDFILVSLDSIIREKINFTNFIDILIEEKVGLLGVLCNTKNNHEIEKQFEQIIKFNDISFPIFRIPSNISYNNIVSTLGCIEDMEGFLVEQFKNNLIYLKNTDYFSTNNILRMISSYVGRLSFLLTPNGEILDIATADSQIEKDNISTDTILSLIKDNIPSTMSTINPIIYNDGNGIYTIYPLRTYNRELGYLCILTDLDRVYKKDYYIKIANEAIPFIIISLITYHEEELMYKKSKDGFIKSLLYGLYSNKQVIEKEAKFFNIEYNLKRFVWIINIKPLKASDSEPLISEKTSINIINQTLNIAKTSFYDDSFITNSSSIVFIKVKDDTPNKDLLKKYNSLLNTLEFQMPEYKFSIGISRAYDNLNNLNLAYEDAIFSLRIGSKIFKNKKAIYAYDDLIIYHLLYKYPYNSILERLYNNIVGQILDYDQQNNTTLFETIHALVEHNFNFSEAADGLFIHRNTLYQRIKKVEEIIGLDMDNSETRLILHLGLKIHDIFSLNLK